MTHISKTEVMQLLQHRDPFLYVDEAVIVDSATIKGVCSIPKTHVVFKGHFPGVPIVPGVLLIESAAQVSGLKMLHDTIRYHRCKIQDISYKSYLVKVVSFTFKSVLVPDVVIQIQSSVYQMGVENYYRAKNHIYADDRLIAIGQIVLYFKYHKKEDNNGGI